MAVAATRSVVITLSGDVDANLQYNALNNAASPGDIGLYTLDVGANTILLPEGGAVVRAVTIIPPAGNEAVLTLKGVAGDTGILIHPTDPTSIAFSEEDPPVSFVIDSDIEVIGLRVIWT